MKKILILFLACCMTLPLFIGCNNNGDGDDTTAPDTDEVTTEEIIEETTTEPEIEETDPPKEQLVLLENKATAYKIITPKGATHYISDAVNEFVASVNSKYESTFTVCDDTVENLAEGQFYESDAAEILVGATNRKESQEVLATLKDNEYKVCVVGNKLVLVGKNEYLTSLAVKDFAEAALSSEDNAKLSIDLDLAYIGKNTADTIGDSDATIRIMTFNVFGKESKYMSRITHIIRIIQRYNPDIISLQECNKEQHQNLVNQLTLLKGYGLATEKHPGSTTYVYTPIIYRKDKIELVEASAEWLDSRYTSTNTKSLAWAVFKNIKTNEQFGVVNIHGSLWSDSYTLPAGKTHEEMHALASAEWKPDNIRQMNDRTKAITDKYGEIAILWTGDFNFDLTHEAYAKATVEYKMHDAEMSATDSSVPNIRTWHPAGARHEVEEGGSIDHIFGNSKVIFRNHKICYELDDEVAASDHYAVYADVKITP